MKRMISTFIAIMLLLGITVLYTAHADEETLTDIQELKPADYNLSGLSFSNGKLTGQAIHVDGTETVKHLYLRITYFAKNGTTMIVETFVHSDGTFSSYASGSISAIAISLTDVTGTPTMLPGDFKEFDIAPMII